MDEPEKKTGRLVLKRWQGEAVIIESPDGEQLRIKVQISRQGQIVMIFDGSEQFLIARQEIAEGLFARRRAQRQEAANRGE